MKYKIIIVLLVLSGCVYSGYKMGDKIVYRDIEKEVILDNLTNKTNELKGNLIKDMWDIERGGHLENDGLITFDPNPKNKKINPASLGTCQFKQSTIQYYVQKLDGRTITGKQANDIAFSDEKCKELMSKIVFTYLEGHEEWYNTCKKIDCDSQLKVIRLLEAR